MNTHEYQAKNLLQRYGILSPPYGIATNEREVIRVIRELGLDRVVLKIQVYAGGRGKAGGVKICENAEEAVRLSKELLGMRLINEQTGPEGIVAEKLLISAPVDIEKEYYLAALIDREQGIPVLIGSPEGGMAIEEVAKRNPEKILKIPICLSGKIRSYHLLEMAKFLGWSGPIRAEGMQILSKLALAFLENDGSLLELNPLALTREGKLLALDAKFSLDDNALYRQHAFVQWYDPSQFSKNEVMAKEFNLAYIGLKGNIGCLVNGAGLAMATMDLIKYHGGEPANFLDVGGSATKEEIAHGFKIILLDKRVKAIFVNIFGGIMDCGVLAEGIVKASKEDKVSVPLIVRLEGTNVQAGKKALQDSGLNIYIAENLEEGAKKAFESAKRDT